MVFHFSTVKHNLRSVYRRFRLVLTKRGLLSPNVSSFAFSVQTPKAEAVPTRFHYSFVSPYFGFVARHRTVREQGWMRKSRAYRLTGDQTAMGTPGIVNQMTQNGNLDADSCSTLCHHCIRCADIHRHSELKSSGGMAQAK